MDIPISFLITRYDLTKDRFEETLNDSTECTICPCAQAGTHLMKEDYIAFSTWYDDWLIYEIESIEYEKSFYNAITKTRSLINERQIKNASFARSC